MQEDAGQETPPSAFAPREESIRAALEPIALAMGSSACAPAAALWWRLGAVEGTVRSTAERGRDSGIEAALRATAQRIELEGLSSANSSDFVLSPRELSASRNGRRSIVPDDKCAVIHRATAGSAEVRAVLLAATQANETALRAAAELGCYAALGVLAADEKEQSRAFWRKRCTDAFAQCSRLRSQADAFAAQLHALESELTQQRTMAARLALRIFTAVDEERARIARDLHDDNAQLIAATLIALEGGREEARAIFKRVAEELRRKVRNLRPAVLGERTLEQALRAEFKVLREAGIGAKLVRGAGADTLSRSAQELCWHVAREALSNVIRHSHASRVRLAISRRPGCAVIAVEDDGCGMPAEASRRGTGLGGLRERLETMGGRLTIESRPGTTRLVAEIPELS